MEIRALTPSQLQAFIFSEEYRQMAVVPISRHRAWSHIRNPRVQPEDKIMFLAYEGAQMAGYLGVLADTIYLEKKPLHAGWLSCLWIDPAIRGKGIAKKLLQQALEAWEQRILVQEFTPAAKGLYDRSAAFRDLKISQGIRCYLRFNTRELLPPKHRLFQKTKKAFSLADAAINTIRDFQLSFKKINLDNTGIKLEYVNEVDEEAWQFIRQQQEHEFTRRNKQELNWVIQNPWILSAPTPDRYSSRYHFSAIDRQFQFLNIKIYNIKDELIGFLILSIRNGHLRTPYLYFDNENISIISTLIIQLMLRMKLNMLSTFNPVLSEILFNEKTPFYLKRKLKRHYIISNVFKDKIEEPGSFMIQDGAADAAFT